MDRTKWSNVIKWTATRGLVLALALPAAMTSAAGNVSVEDTDSTLTWVFDVPDDPSAMFPGNITALRQFLKDNLTVTDTVTVTLQLYIGQDGTIGDIKVEQSLSEKADNDALRAVSLMPKFIPRRVQGRPVPSQYTLKIEFPAGKLLYR